MSVDLMRLCWRIEFPTPAMSAVAVKLADCANDEGENIYPSVGRIERECRLGGSTVRRVLAAFEEAGLLEVVAEAHGNRWLRSTTIRRFNVGLLHALSAIERRHGKSLAHYRSSHVLAETLDGNRTRWRVVERTPDMPSDYPTDAAPPLPEREGSSDSTPPTAGEAKPGHPSHSGRGPLPQREGAPPAAGANPSLEPSGKKESPPPHRCATGGSDKSDLQGKGEALCQAAEAAGAPHPVVAHLLRPVLTERRFSAAGDKVTELVALARSAKDLPVPALERATRLLLEAGVATIKAQRFRDAIAAAKAGGAMVVVRKGSAQWQRWVEHFERTKSTEAALMRRYESWQVRAEWPPSFAGASRLASGEPAGTRGPDAPISGEVSP